MSFSENTEKPKDPALRQLVDFYDPLIQGADNKGRKLAEILDWDDRRLERTHNFIQVLFPLPDYSRFNGDAPILDKETCIYFRQHPGLQDSLKQSLKRMLSFYGFTIEWEPNGEVRMQVSQLLQGRNKGLSRWLKPLNHNHLRITRIIRSLRVLGLAEEAEVVYQNLAKVCKVNEKKVEVVGFKYWTGAAKNPLHYAPNGMQIEWLEELDQDSS
ncbi:opioid growth factor receptor conserved region-domain-containing protein [Hypoxylon fragiforme]|uniref:opioid growth factor receptor conserved region-domain-containing protein n=1 Tax=Hypoxylon fragiforme TaxID=63214 RepID=UPI0020C63FE4|nr:opioid growth factor receptor conserved region-domain-containing protein [Hypoxylon fragiforme]KAI2611770.1 opioid growth factor receptor conserved region-domain-containing protein [Hypoxylon fragiforme]